MKSLVAAALLACSGYALAQDESFRIFFDPTGNDGTDEGPRAAANLSFINPTIVSSGRLFLYMQYGTNNQDFTGVNLRVDVIGPGKMTAGNFYNHHIGALQRWHSIPGKSFSTDRTSFLFGSVYKIDSNGYGAKNVASYGSGPPDGVDSHFDRSDGGIGFGTTLLGWIDVAHTAGSGAAQIFLQNGTSGNAGFTVTAEDYVYFGFGDPAVKNKKGAANGGLGGPTAIAEAFITPEPMSVALIGVWALALRRRR